MKQNQTRVVAVIDDDQGCRNACQFLLELSGHTVLTYPSAESYIEDDPRSACAIVDLHLGRMSGLEFAARLRADGNPLPILLVTGAPTAAVMSSAAQLGIEAVLPKPTEVDALLRFVDAHVDRATPPSL